MAGGYFSKFLFPQNEQKTVFDAYHDVADAESIDASETKEVVRQAVDDSSELIPFRKLIDYKILYDFLRFDDAISLSSALFQFDSVL
jgi:hypothetical protein